jgi:hypothetical protein
LSMFIVNVAVSGVADADVREVLVAAEPTGRCEDGDDGDSEPGAPRSRRAGSAQTESRGGGPASTATGRERVAEQRAEA